jgi:putative phage-type endonuclease
MIYKDVEQGTPEWFEMRCGKVTASRMADVTAKTKTGYGAGRKNYMAELLVERLTGKTAESYTNTAMQWGIDTEPQARAAYCFLYDAEVEQIAFADHPTIELSGASPDGLVGDKGLIEIKCPNTATHIDYLLTNKVPDKYVKQMQWQMACLKREWCDFVSFDPRLPEKLQILRLRFERDDDLIPMLENEVSIFNEELSEKLEKLEQL